MLGAGEMVGAECMEGGKGSETRKRVIINKMESRTEEARGGRKVG